MKIEIKGFLHEIEKERTVSGKNGDTRIKDLLIKIPERKDDFGDVVQEVQFYPVSVFNKRIEELPLFLEKGAKVKVTCYLQSRAWHKENEGTRYNLGLVLAKLEVIV